MFFLEDTKAQKREQFLQVMKQKDEFKSFLKDSVDNFSRTICDQGHLIDQSEKVEPFSTDVTLTLFGQISPQGAFKKK